MRTTARRVGWRLGPRRCQALDRARARVADVAVVWARTDDGVRGFLVERGDARLHGRRTSPTSCPLARPCSPTCASTASRVARRTRCCPARAGCAAPSPASTEARYGIVWGVTGAARYCLATRRSRRAASASSSAARSPRFQLTQAQACRDGLRAEPRHQLLALRLGRLKDAGPPARRSRSASASSTTSASAPSTSRARRARSSAARASRAANAIMRHMVESRGACSTYEGTAEVHTLILGSALTGHRAFA